MTEEELLKEFDSEFERDCYYYPDCELCDCSECSTYWDLFEEYKEEHGYVPGIKVGL